MSTYVDGYVLPVPRARLEEYRQIAARAGAVWREHGALSYRECAGDDLAVEGMLPFTELSGAGPDDTVVFAWVEFASRAERDRINALVMNDPRLAGMSPEAMPFDCRRMAYGGFQTLVAA
ncbi:MAG: DUF1428 domain-containing protein [Xanthomonadales bacterium]|nr:DUF1428 domain-containing protein [Xanthomonadales bacterium]